MRERGILMTAANVRSILAGTKTQTRRKVKGVPLSWLDDSGFHPSLVADPRNDLCPYGVVGELLWLREAWHVGKCADGLKPAELHPGTWLSDNGGLWFPADDTQPRCPISPKGRYRHARFMPRWASRITLEITDVRVERLQEISEADAIAEGIGRYDNGTFGLNDPGACMGTTAVVAYMRLWESINADRVPWESNPWVWVLQFRRV